MIAGWSSLVARWAHNPKVGGSNPSPATSKNPSLETGFLLGRKLDPVGKLNHIKKLEKKF